jgi:hypothetical protein
MAWRIVKAVGVFSGVLLAAGWMVYVSEGSNFHSLVEMRNLLPLIVGSAAFAGLYFVGTNHSSQKLGTGRGVGDAELSDRD